MMHPTIVDLKKWFSRIVIALTLISAGDLLSILWAFIPPEGEIGIVKVWLLRVTFFLFALVIVGSIFKTAQYIEFQRSLKQPVGALVWVGFATSIALDFLVNAGTIWQHRHAAAAFSEELAATFAVVFGVMISLTMYNMATSDKRLERSQQFIDAQADAEKQRHARQADDARQLDEEKQRQVDARQHKADFEQRQAERQAELDYLRQLKEINETHVKPRRQSKTAIRVVNRQPKQLPPVNQNNQIPVNVDGKIPLIVNGVERWIDARVPDWLTMHDNNVSYEQISDSLGGKPSKQYIGALVKLYRDSLTVDAERG